MNNSTTFDPKNAHPVSLPKAPCRGIAVPPPPPAGPPGRRGRGHAILYAGELDPGPSSRCSLLPSLSSSLGRFRHSAAQTEQHSQLLFSAAQGERHSKVLFAAALASHLSRSISPFCGPNRTALTTAVLCGRKQTPLQSAETAPNGSDRHIRTPSRDQDCT